MANQGASDYTPYSDPVNTAPRGAEAASGGARQGVSDTASKAQEKAKDLGRTAEAKINEKREPAAGALENAATAIHEKADDLPGGDRVSEVAHSAADKLQSTADYVRENDVRDMMIDVEQFVKSHPTQSLIVAAAAGFLVGRAFGRD